MNSVRQPLSLCTRHHHQGEEACGACPRVFRSWFLSRWMDTELKCWGICFKQRLWAVLETSLSSRESTEEPEVKLPFLSSRCGLSFYQPPLQPHPKQVCVLLFQIRKLRHGEGKPLTHRHPVLSWKTSTTLRVVSFHSYPHSGFPVLYSLPHFHLQPCLTPILSLLES